MGNYIQSAINNGENVVYEGKVSLWSLTGYFLSGIFAMLLIALIYPPAFFLGAIFWFSAWVRWWTTELAVTNKRIIAKTGLISRKTVELNLPRIESIQVTQGIIGRIFNFGSIIVSGAGNPQAPIPGISKPMDFRRACIDTQESNATH